MAKGRNFTFKIPQYLLEQIAKRALVNDRSRNAEIRYLLSAGLGYAGEADVTVALPSTEETDWPQIPGRFDREGFEAVSERAQQFHRSVGREMVRLLAYAIEESARRDLAVISGMMSRQGSRAPLR